MPLHSNSTGQLSKSIGKSLNMDLVDTESENLVNPESKLDDHGGDDKQQPWNMITTLKQQEIRNLKKTAEERQKRGLQERHTPDKEELELLQASKKRKRE